MRFFPGQNEITKTTRGKIDGQIRWVNKKPSKIFTCACGCRYLKTRPRQKTCVPCMYGHAGAANFRGGMVAGING